MLIKGFTKVQILYKYNIGQFKIAYNLFKIIQCIFGSDQFYIFWNSFIQSYKTSKTADSKKKNQHSYKKGLIRTK